MAKFESKEVESLISNYKISAEQVEFLRKESNRLIKLGFVFNRVESPSVNSKGIKSVSFKFSYKNTGSGITVRID